MLLLFQHQERHHSDGGQAEDHDNDPEDQVAGVAGLGVALGIQLLGGKDPVHLAHTVGVLIAQLFGNLELDGEGDAAEAGNGSQEDVVLQAVQLVGRAGVDALVALPDLHIKLAKKVAHGGNGLAGGSHVGTQGVGLLIMGHGPEIDADAAGVEEAVPDLNGLGQGIAGHDAFEAVKEVGIGIAAAREEDELLRAALVADGTVSIGGGADAQEQHQHHDKGGNGFTGFFHFRTSLCFFPGVVAVNNAPGVDTGASVVLTTAEHLDGLGQDVDFTAVKAYFIREQRCRSSIGFHNAVVVIIIINCCPGRADFKARFVADGSDIALFIHRVGDNGNTDEGLDIAVIGDGNIRFNIVAYSLVDLDGHLAGDHGVGHIIVRDQPGQGAADGQGQEQDKGNEQGEGLFAAACPAGSRRAVSTRGAGCGMFTLIHLAFPLS